MPRISNFILSDSIANIPVSNGVQVPQLTAPQLVLRTEFIPSFISFVFSIGILDVNFKRENTLSITILDTNGEQLFAFAESKVPSAIVEEKVPQEYQGFLFSADVRNLVIKNEGVYKLNVIFNGESIGKCDIPIYKK